jgi:hypothetical protein
VADSALRGCSTSGGRRNALCGFQAANCVEWRRRWRERPPGQALCCSGALRGATAPALARLRTTAQLGYAVGFPRVSLDCARRDTGLRSRRKNVPTGGVSFRRQLWVECLARPLKRDPDRSSCSKVGGGSFEPLLVVPDELNSPTSRRIAATTDHFRPPFSDTAAPRPTKRGLHPLPAASGLRLLQPAGRIGNAQENCKVKINRQARRERQDGRIKFSPVSKAIICICLVTLACLAVQETTLRFS